jgi:hypothetical protein
LSVASTRTQSRLTSCGLAENVFIVSSGAVGSIRKSRAFYCIEPATVKLTRNRSRRR